MPPSGDVLYFGRPRISFYALASRRKSCTSPTRKTQSGKLICQWCRKGSCRCQKRDHLALVEWADRRTEHAPEARQTTNVRTGETRSPAGETDEPHSQSFSKPAPEPILDADYPHNGSILHAETQFKGAKSINSTLSVQPDRPSRRSSGLQVPSDHQVAQPRPVKTTRTKVAGSRCFFIAGPPRHSCAIESRPRA